ncbi:HlyD family type I secretion periplasmic adaptor subunit [Roseibium album]|uniref:Membrane fusion protein (MFP) family protein n=1 Tax=Roseibium album TaxID=311410 RepID=A0A0M7AY24_9HYPH|nr:HlyD family type I secretion periplasmic adaptor subunit [Roseibium album]MBG6143775.1 HlyD family type I secretion membrane fusion protein [Labrenzia sp. EL_142]MCR9057512.1 HlyD family type I secretion periplasmic adaptor subunit [Paracoccaceae bacterium]CTQ62410.1 Hemolysin secretion protein D, chromosomal [Roseibium album]CTQ78047.1 Hemolysin secretion protein D, chromosomal [Roseibium album]CTQ80175.1 Hemolysin secretion protein D, chromosomal [Roseibium album]
MFSRKSAKQDYSLDMPLELEDGPPPFAYRRILQVLSLGAAAFLGWSIVGQVREVAKASGEIVPAGKIQTVGHLEGGIVAEVLVEEGQLVEKGTPLVRLQEAATSNDLEKVRTRLQFLAREEQRLTNYSREEKNGDPRFSGDFDFSEAQQAALEAQKKAIEQEQQALKARINEKEAELASVLERISFQRTQVEIEQEKFAIQESLFDQGYTSKRRFLDAKSAHQIAQSELSELIGRKGRAEAQLAEAKASLERFIAVEAEELAEERSRVVQERSELAFEAEKQRDRFDRLYVRAPASGHVKTLNLKGPGSVVAPGDVVAEIVPSDSNLVAEVRVSPRDIGHVEVGDEAEIAVTTFDPNIQGTLKGEVSVVSASSFRDEYGNYYFKAKIPLSSNMIGKGSQEETISPGMVVDAKIVTGSKSVMQYLLKPVTRAIGDPLSER